VTPGPSFVHQRAASRLVRLLIDPPAPLELLFAPFDIPLAEDTVLQPDVVVVGRVDDAYDSDDPELILETWTATQPYEVIICPADLVS